MAEAAAAEEKTKPARDPAKLGKILKLVFFALNLAVVGA
jgi:hypothetical protein